MFYTGLALLLLTASAHSQVSVVLDGKEAAALPTTPMVSQLNGHTLTSVPAYLHNVTYYNPMTLFQSSDAVVLGCNNTLGCTFYLVTYRCGGCNNDDGGVDELLDWERKGGDCAPTFRSNGYGRQPMVIYRKYFAPDTVTNITMTSIARYIGIFNADGEGPECLMCDVEPELLTECSRHCAGDTKTEVAIPRLGKVVGKVEGSHVVYRGVPFAPEPEMFTRSTLVTHYADEIDGTVNGPMCWQPGSKDGSSTVVTSNYNNTAGYSWQKSWSALDVRNSSTNCLNLNIFVPLKDGKYPVMVFIPGGGFYGGGNNDRQLDKSFSDNIVLVIMNYRLGVYGFGLLDEMLGSGGVGGNFGLTDQQIALHYVNQFISSFKGDSNRVTIFGESAGGTSVAYHYVTPSSQGLFHRAILESAGTAQVNTVEWETENTLQLASMVAYSELGMNENCTLLPTYKEYVDYTVIDIEGSEGVHFSDRTKKEVQATCDNWSQNYQNCSGYSYSVHHDGTIKGHYVTMPNVLERNQINICSSIQGNTVALRPIDPASAFKCLTSTSPEKLVRYSTNIGPFPDTFFHNKWSPVVDGITLHKSIPDLIDEGIGNDIDLLTGSNLDEGTFFVSCTDVHLEPNMDRSDFLRWVDLTFGSETRRIIDNNDYYSQDDLIQPLPMGYNISHPSRRLSYNAAVRAGGDSEFRCRSLQILDSSVADNKYLYHFSQISSIDVNNTATSDNYYYGSYHGLELEYLFQYSHPLNSEPNSPANNSNGEIDLMHNMGCYWSNFAETGVPNQGGCALTDDAATWLPYKTSSQNMIEFKAGNDNDESQVQELGELYYNRCQALLLKQIPSGAYNVSAVNERYCEE